VDIPVSLLVEDSCSNLRPLFGREYQNIKKGSKDTRMANDFWTFIRIDGFENGRIFC